MKKILWLHRDGYLLGKSKKADVNKDGQVNIEDMTMIALTLIR